MSLEMVWVKQLLWVGSLETDQELIAKARKGAAIASEQVSQNNLLLGLEKASGLAIDSINGSIVPHYPVYSDKVVSEVRRTCPSGAQYVSVKYANFKYLNRLTCRRAMEREGVRWVEERYAGQELIIFAYGLRSAPLATACAIKKRVPGAKIYLIVTDLPKYMDLGESRVKAFLKKIDWVGISQMLHKVDGYILYAEPMAEYLRLKPDMWMLMEGSYDAEELQHIRREEESGGVRAIMYSGRMDRRYGVEMLVDAFMNTEGADLELWLTGSGNAEGYIRQCAQKDRRIRFFGFLPSREAVIELQQRAAALVNMRLPSEPASAFCFPSKLFEYMATGKPVLSFRIPGIPQEYFQHMIPIEEESAAGVAKAIRSVFEMDEAARREMGRRAARFVLEEKSTAVQAARICAFTGVK